MIWTAKLALTGLICGGLGFIVSMWICDPYDNETPAYFFYACLACVGLAALAHLWLYV